MNIPLQAQHRWYAKGSPKIVEVISNVASYTRAGQPTVQIHMYHFNGAMNYNMNLYLKPEQARVLGKMLMHHADLRLGKEVAP